MDKILVVLVLLFQSLRKHLDAANGEDKQLRWGLIMQRSISLAQIYTSALNFWV